MLVITTLFLVSGLFLRQRRTTDLAVARRAVSNAAGRRRARDGAAVLAGGRAAAVGIHRQAWRSSPPHSRGRTTGLAAVALAVSLLTLLSMARVWEEAFWKPAPTGVGWRRALGAADARADRGPGRVSPSRSRSRLDRCSSCRGAPRSSCSTPTSTCGRCWEEGERAARQHSARAGLGGAAGRVLAGHAGDRPRARLRHPAWRSSEAASSARSPYIGKVHLVVGLGRFFLWELVRANLRLALDVATPSFHMKPGIIAVPLDVTRDSEILLLAMLINLTPGSVALDVSDDRKRDVRPRDVHEQSGRGASRNQAGIRTAHPAVVSLNAEADAGHLHDGGARDAGLRRRAGVRQAAARADAARSGRGASI